MKSGKNHFFYFCKTNYIKVKNQLKNKELEIRIIE